jgi:hypothetical protein
MGAEETFHDSARGHCDTVGRQAALAVFLSGVVVCTLQLPLWLSGEGSILEARDECRNRPCEDGYFADAQWQIEKSDFSVADGLAEAQAVCPRPTFCSLVWDDEGERDPGKMAGGAWDVWDTVGGYQPGEYTDIFVDLQDVCRDTFCPLVEWSPVDSVRLEALTSSMALVEIFHLEHESDPNVVLRSPGWAATANLNEVEISMSQGHWHAVEKALRAEPRAGGVQPGNGTTAASPSSSKDFVKTTLERMLGPPPNVTLSPTEPPTFKPCGDLEGTFESESFQRLLDKQPPCLATVFQDWTCPKLLHPGLDCEDLLVSMQTLHKDHDDELPDSCAVPLNSAELEEYIRESCPGSCGNCMTGIKLFGASM